MDREGLKRDIWNLVDKLSSFSDQCILLHYNSETSDVVPYYTSVGEKYLQIYAEFYVNFSKLCHDHERLKTSVSQNEMSLSATSQEKQRQNDGTQGGAERLCDLNDKTRNISCEAQGRQDGGSFFVWKNHLIPECDERITNVKQEEDAQISGQNNLSHSREFNAFCSNSTSKNDTDVSEDVRNQNRTDLTCRLVKVEMDEILDNGSRESRILSDSEIAVDASQESRILTESEIKTEVNDDSESEIHGCYMPYNMQRNIMGAEGDNVDQHHKTGLGSVEFTYGANEEMRGIPTMVHVMKGAQETPENNGSRVTVSEIRSQSGRKRKQSDLDDDDHRECLPQEKGSHDTIGLILGVSEPTPSPENEVSREAESQTGQEPQTEQEVWEPQTEQEPQTGQEPQTEQEVGEPQTEQEPQTEEEPQAMHAPHIDGQKENQGRFRDVSMEEISQYFDSTQSKSTKFNTKWCMKIIQDWSSQICGQLIDFETVSTHALADILMKFYCSAKPQKKEKGKEEYHKNTLKNIRAGINRHLQDIGRNINIVNDREFKAANRVFSGLLKERVKSGASLPTKHKEIISKDDMKAIRQYFLAAPGNPVVLRHFVWFSIAFHFVTRGNETHFHLTPQSFSFQSDNRGEFVMIVHETMQKNHQGGAGDKAESSGKVMYATEGPLCPVRMLRLLLQKTNPQAQKLFNQYNSDAIYRPVSTAFWYTDKPLGQRTFGNFMPDISKSANTIVRYTNHCVRATAIQNLKDADVE